MNTETVKQWLQRDKLFLKNLYEGDQLCNRNTLKNADDLKIKTLIVYFHFLSKGEIKIKKEIFQKLPNYVIKLLKRNFEKKSSTQKLIQSTRLEKIKILNRLNQYFSLILYPLFNE